MSRIVDAVKLATEIERIKRTDPSHYERIMRKLAEIELRAKKAKAS